MIRKLLVIATLAASFLLARGAFALQCGLDKDAVPTSASAGIEIAFSPNGGATDLVVKTIREAHTSVRVAAYSFTSKPISLALLDASKRGIDVRVVVDKSNVADRHTAATLVANEHMPVRVDWNYAIMHDKFIVVDGITVEEGSFNYTGAAEFRNAENVVVLHDPAVAQKYAQEWDRLWDESQELKPRY